jgi:hypothetical protein
VKKNGETPSLKYCVKNNAIVENKMAANDVEDMVLAIFSDMQIDQAKNNTDDNEIINLLENYEIGKLDINRIYRYIEKYIKENATGTADKDIEEEEEEESEEC